MKKVLWKQKDKNQDTVNMLLNYYNVLFCFRNLRLLDTEIFHSKQEAEELSFFQNKVMKEIGKSKMILSKKYDPVYPYFLSYREIFNFFFSCF